MGKIEDLQREEAELGDAIATARIARAKAKADEDAAREQLSRVRTLRAIRASEESEAARHAESAARLLAKIPVAEKQPAPSRPPRSR